MLLTLRSNAYQYTTAYGRESSEQLGSAYALSDLAAIGIRDKLKGTMLWTEIVYAAGQRWPDAAGTLSGARYDFGTVLDWCKGGPDRLRSLYKVFDATSDPGRRLLQANSGPG
jgi:hypothetical protein